MLPSQVNDVGRSDVPKTLQQLAIYLLHSTHYGFLDQNDKTICLYTRSKTVMGWDKPLLPIARCMEHDVNKTCVFSKGDCIVAKKFVQFMSFQ